MKTIVGAGIPMTSTLAVFVPHFGPDNTPLDTLMNSVVIEPTR